MDYRAKVERLEREMREAKGSVQLRKNTTNLFRRKDTSRGAKIDVRDFNNVIEVNAKEGWVNVEGMTTFEKLVDECLKYDVMPAVVPELKSITIGGATSGLGIEASSFRYGLVHESLIEMDILLPNGTVVTARPDNEYRELFFGIPNSFGTLGYVMRVKALAVPVKKFVHIKHERFEDRDPYFETMRSYMDQSDIDFLEGEIFSENEMYITTGTFIDTAPYTSDYTYMNIYYKTIRTRTEDYLSVHDFIWRWDTDWFWDSKFFGAEYPLMRRLLGKKRLNSIFYMKMLRLSRKPFFRFLGSFVRRKSEPVIQDIPIPVERASEFLDFFQKEIGITPVWICPIGVYNSGHRFPLFSLDARKRYFNFGFWDIVKTRPELPLSHFNRLVEKKMMDVGGMKSLYSDSFFTKEEFWKLYDKRTYDDLKKKFDPNAKLKGMYEKCVLKV